jgi:glutamate synthase (NADPH/NADH) large chain
MIAAMQYPLVFRSILEEFGVTSPSDIQHMQQHGLYDPANEHDACGVGFVAHIKGQKSHAIVGQALKILENLDHRGAVGADALMGDGAGILIQLPDQLFRDDMAKTGKAPDGSVGVALPPAGEYGVGMIFLPKEHASRLACEQEMERAIKAEGQVLLGWRDVPVNRDMPMSPRVRAKEPIIRQVFIGRGNDVIVQDALERKLYVIRKKASKAIQAGPEAQQRVLRAEHEQPHHHLQGPAAGRPGGHLLP